MQDLLDKAEDYLDKAIEALDDFVDFFYAPSGLQWNFNQITQSNLDAISDTEGFGPVVMHVGEAAEGAITLVGDILNNATVSFPHVEISNRVRDDVAPYLDRATGNPFQGFVDVYAAGALYYMLQLANSSADRMVLYDDPVQHTVLFDREGGRYEDDKVCLTVLLYVYMTIYTY